MTVRQRMLALKTSYEPRITLGLFAALGYMPKMVAGPALRPSDQPLRPR